MSEMLFVPNLTSEEVGIKPIKRGEWIAEFPAIGSAFCKFQAAVAGLNGYVIAEFGYNNRLVGEALGSLPTPYREISTTIFGLTALRFVSASLYCDYKIGMNLIQTAKNMALYMTEMPQSPRVR